MSFFDELKRRNVLRIAAAYLVGAWLIVQVANEVLAPFGFDDAASRILIIILAIGFIPAVIVAWVFELTPDGLERDTGSSVTVNTAAAKRLDRIIILVLTVAVVFFAVHTFILDDDSPSVDLGDRRIAVLPFDNLSSDSEQSYFAAGVAGDIQEHACDDSGTNGDFERFIGGCEITRHEHRRNRHRPGCCVRSRWIGQKSG